MLIGCSGKVSLQDYATTKSLRPQTQNMHQTRTKYPYLVAKKSCNICTAWPTISKIQVSNFDQKKYVLPLHLQSFRPRLRDNRKSDPTKTVYVWEPCR